MPTAVKLEPLIEMHCMVTALWRRFAVHLFEGKLTVADMDRIEANSEVWHGRVNGKVVEMVVILPSDAKMTGEERTRMSRIIKRWENKRQASATVVLAQGLVGSMHRSVLTGIQMLAPPPHPVKVFGSIADAVGWLSPHVVEVCGVEAKPDELTAAVRDLSARFAERGGVGERRAIKP
jgi:hypothetical protein